MAENTNSAIIESVIFYQCPERSNLTLAKERKRIDINSNNSLQQIIKTISDDGGLEAETEKIGLGGLIQVTISRIEKLDGATKVFSISTDTSWNLEKHHLKESPILQVNVKKKQVAFVKNTPVIQLVFGETSSNLNDEKQQRQSGGGKKRSITRLKEEDIVKRIKRGESIVREKEQQDSLNVMQKDLEDLGCTAINEYTILCGKCQKTLTVPIDRTPAKRVQYFRNRHTKHTESMERKETEPDYKQEQRFMSTWIKTKELQPIEIDIDMDEKNDDSDLDTELSQTSLQIE